MRKIREWEARQDARAEKLLMSDGGGGAQSSGPTQQNVTQTNIPEYARPYVENLLGRAQAATSQDQYQQYGGQRIANFTGLQNQAFQNIGNMQVAPQVGQASGLAGASGMGLMGLAPQAGAVGQNYANMATDPNSVAAYMSPYQQNVTDIQKREAIRQAGIQGTQRNAAASGAGAFGGTRQALVDAEANRNLNTQLNDIQAQGSQSAFQNAQQAQQFGANLGLQGLNAQAGIYQGANQAAANLGQLGQNQYQQQMGINSAQQQAGGQQQALEQQKLSQAYQDFQNQVRFPYQQMGFMSDIIHGMPLTGTSTQSLYQAPPSASNQLMAYGLGAYGLSNLFGGGKKEGGAIKGFAVGGGVGALPQSSIKSGPYTEGDTRLAALQRIRALAQQPKAALQKAAADGNPEAAEALRLQELKIGLQGMQAQAQLSHGVGALPGADVDVGMAGGGIVAFGEGDVVRLPPMAMDETVRSRQGVAASLASMAEAKEGPSWWERLFRKEPRRTLSPEEFGIVTPEVPKEQLSPAALEAGDYGIAALTPAATPPAPKVSGSASAAAPKTSGPQMPAARPELPKYEEQGIAGLDTSPEAMAAMQKQFAEAAANLTKPQREALEKEIAKNRARLEGDKEGRLDTARGLAALQAASKLTQSGKHKATAIGEAFGVAGTEAEKYVKQEQAINDKLAEADVAHKQAMLAVAQGDAKMGADLMKQSQETRVAAAKVSGERAYQKAMAEAKLAGLSDEMAMHRAAAAKYAAEASILIPAHAAAFRATAANAGQKGQLTDAALAGIRDKATDNVRQFLAQNPLMQLQATKDPAYMQRLFEQEFNKLIGRPAPPAPSRITATPPSGEVAGALKMPG